MNYDYLLYEEIDRVARITLNRPEKLNALSIPLQTELIQAAKHAEADPNIHAVILRGAGRAFSAGYDITPTAARGQDQGGGHQAGQGRARKRPHRAPPRKCLDPTALHTADRSAGA